ncbi:MAG TPA: response regulator [Methylomirabilota bacterium]|nr:response regulator [Methylomirabilota bacterium]
MTNQPGSPIPPCSQRMRAKKTVLIAEDDADDVFLLQRAFSKAGINANLQFASDGEEAIRYLLSADQQENPIPDLLLLDLKMPRVDGFTVLDWVRKQPGLKRLLVTVLTSSGARVDINRAYDLGANSYLLKPFSNENLVQLVGHLQAYWLGINFAPECDASQPRQVGA